jgi:hypothetical protein
VCGLMWDKFLCGRNTQFYSPKQTSQNNSPHFLPRLEFCERVNPPSQAEAPSPASHVYHLLTMRPPEMSVGIRM